MADAHGWDSIKPKGGTVRRSALVEVLFLLAVLGMSIGILTTSATFEFRALLLPSIGATAALLLGLYQLVRILLGKERDTTRPESAVDLSSVQAAADDASDPSGRVEAPVATSEPLAPHWLGLFWLSLFTVLVYVLGLAAGALLFTVVYMRIRARDGIVRIALVLGTLAVVLLFLINVLGARIYTGVLF